MTDYIIIALLALIWFQGTRYSRELSNDFDRLQNRFKQWMRNARTH